MIFFVLHLDKSVRITPERPYSPMRAQPHTVTPRKYVPVPATYEPPQFDVSPIPANGLDNEEVPNGRHDGVPQTETHEYYSPKKILQEQQISEGGSKHVSNIVKALYKTQRGC